VIDEILEKYRNIQMVRSLCKVILNSLYFIGKIAICLTIFIIVILFSTLWRNLQRLGIEVSTVFIILLSVYFIFDYIYCLALIPGWKYFLNPIYILTDSNKKTLFVNGCPCL
jgi:hypothetical protein